MPWMEASSCKKVSSMATKDCCTWADTCPSSDIRSLAWSTDWVISSRTWPNWPAVSLMLEKDSPRSWSLDWNWSPSRSTLEKEAPTRLSSQREATSFLTSSCWYSFRLPAT